MDTTIFNKVICFINEHFNSSDIVGIMLTGSYADQTNKRNSDIDIIVISMIAARQSHENIIKDNTMYQLIIFPYCKVASLIYEDYITGKGIFFKMFIKGIILLDKKEVLYKIQRLLCNQKMPVNSEYDILRLRRLITNDIEYILGDGETNKFLSAIEVVRETSQLITGNYAPVGKHLDRLLEKYKNEEQLLQNSLKTYLTNKDGSQFAYAIGVLLKPFGGLLEKYTTSYQFNVPHDKHILVFLPGRTMNNKTVMEISQQILDICKSPYYCIVFYEGQNQMMEQGVYFFIYSETGSISTIISLLDKTRILKLDDLKSNEIFLSYPYQSCFYEGIYIGGLAIFKNLAPHLSQLTTIFISSYKLYEQFEQLNFQRILSIKTLHYYICSIFKDLSERNSFLLECVHFFLPEAVDVNGVYSLNQLNGIKEQVLHFHHEMYSVNENSLSFIIQQEDQTALQVKMIIKNICGIINKYTTDNNDPIQILYTTSDYALHLHIVSHLFSIYQLTPCEKFSLIYYLFNLSNKYVVQ